MKKKSCSFYVPGIHHPIPVKLVTLKWLARKAKDPSTIAMIQDGKIYVGKSLDPEAQLHAFYHELAHHIVDTLEMVNEEETRCDLLGTYLTNIGKDADRIAKALRAGSKEK